MLDMNNKLISIIDCFIYNDNVKKLLVDKINLLKSIGRDVMLISNSVVDKEIVENVDFFLYDKNNNLFEYNYENYEGVDFYEYFEHFDVHNIISSKQPHGLSVLINIFRAVKMAKVLGYDFFERHEVDDVMGEDSIKFLKDLPLSNFYFVNERGDIKSDISFHYFMFEIDFFLKNIKRVRNENDYKLNIKDFDYTDNFYSVEQYFYNYLKVTDIHEDNLKNKIKDCFNDTFWNTSSTPENFNFNMMFNLYKKNNDLENNVFFIKNNAQIEKNIVFRYGDIKDSITLKNNMWFYRFVPKEYSLDLWINDEYYNLVCDETSYINFK